MGHYHSEMQCDRCGSLHCTCPPKPEPPNNNWMVDADWEILTVDEHDKKHATKGHPLMRRLRMPEFADKKDAIAHAKQLIETQITSHEERILRLKEVRKRLPK